MIEDGPQSPRDDESARKVALGGRERVGSCGGLQEEARKEIRGVSDAKRPTFGSETYRARKTKTLVQTPA